MRWLPVIFTIGTWYLSATSAMRRSSSALVTPPRMRGIDRERAVLLDVGVHAIVDEARRAILVVVAAPQHVEHVAERRLADLAADAVAVDLEHLLHRLAAAGCAGSRAGGPRRTARSRRCTFLTSSSNSGATARSRSWHRPVQLPQPVLARVRSLSCDSVLTPLLVDGLDDRALGHADAAADGGAVGHLARRRARRRRPAAETAGGGAAPMRSAPVRSQSM